MLSSIQIHHNALIKKFKQKNGIVLAQRTNNNHFFQEEKKEKNDKEQDYKKIIPIKQYSNKFLKQSNESANCKQNEKVHQQTRLNSIIKKHKVLQKKYNKLMSKKIYMCKTEPNEPQYQCSMTFTNLHSDKVMHSKQKIELPQFQSSKLSECAYRGDKQEQLNLLTLQSEHIKLNNFALRESLDGDVKRIPQQIKIKEHFLSLVREQKISTSRALEIYSRLLSKDKRDIDKVKVSNPKKLIKDKILESTKNLQARQIMFFEKDKKLSVVEKGQKQFTNKIIHRLRKKTMSDMSKDNDQQQNYEVRGWDVGL